MRLRRRPPEPLRRHNRRLGRQQAAEKAQQAAEEAKDVAQGLSVRLDRQDDTLRMIWTQCGGRKDAHLPIDRE